MFLPYVRSCYENEEKGTETENIFKQHMQLKIPHHIYTKLKPQKKSKKCNKKT